MEEKEIYSIFEKILSQLSDRNSCLTNLAKSRLQIMQDMGKMAFNHKNDLNGNWAKWEEMKEQLGKIDQLIRDVSSACH